MRTMRFVFYIAGGMALFAISGIAGCHKPHKTSPKDTPIVAGGGSIWGCSYGYESDGWTKRWWLLEKYHSASLHADNPNSSNYQNGNDYLSFTNFDGVQQNPVSGTNGWVISISNKDANGNRKADAVKICSDKKCSASSQPDCKNNSFDKFGRVYFEHRDGSELRTTGSPIKQINFHDTDPNCKPGGISKCDEIYDVTLETCNNGQLGPFKCQQDALGQKCRITVGRVVDNPPPCPDAH